MRRTSGRAQLDTKTLMAHRYWPTPKAYARRLQEAFCASTHDEVDRKPPKRKG